MKEFNLGKTTNLLYGYDASWLTKENGNNALYPSEEAPLELSPVKKPETSGKWGFPEISLHDSAESLLTTLLPYKVENPSDGIPEPSLPAGPLLISDKDSQKAIKILSETLGVNLSASGVGFALIQLKRNDTSTSHAVMQQNMLVQPNLLNIPEKLGVKKEFITATSSLKRYKSNGSPFDPGLIKADDANTYLGFFKGKGTHFISNIKLGDVFFQILVMPQERYDKVKKTYLNKETELSGSNAILFRQFTSNHNTGQYGYVKEFGKILSFSQSETLNRTLKNGDWIENTFAKENSLFALYQNEAKISAETLNKDYLEYTSIETSLTSLTLFMEYNRKQLWRRIFTAAVIQKFRNAIKPQFIKYCNSDLENKLKQDELPGFLSNIATPEINTYKTSLDISTLDFVAPEEVKNFTLFSNYFFNTQNRAIKIPGNNVLLVLQLVSLENKEFVSTIELNEKAFDTLSLSTQSFYGALQVTNKTHTSHYTIVDGLKYADTNIGSNGKGNVQVTLDVRNSPAQTNIPKLKNDLQFSYSFSEASINTVSDKDIKMQDFLRQSLTWITQIIPSDTKDKDLLDLRVRALNKAYVGKDASMGSFVPVLPYNDYQIYIDSILNYIDEIDSTIDNYQTQIEFRKTKELIIDVAKNLNKNIIDTGKLLSGYVDASISQQNSLSNYYESIINQKKSELKIQDETVNKLWAEVNTQQSEVKTAVKNFQQALKEWKITEEIKFGLKVATDLFAIGSAIFVPASSLSSVKDLGISVQRIQKLLNILNSTYKMFEDLEAEENAMENAQKTFEGIDGILTSNLSWDELSINMDAILSTAPPSADVNAKKTALLTAFKIYVLRGKAYTSAKSSVQQISSDIYNQQRQQELTKEQEVKLKELNTNLQPASIDELDKSKVDLIGLTGSLSLIRSQMLGLLSQTFILKDEVLVYDYLQTPTVISSFDILGIKSALVTQQGNLINAKTALKQYQSFTTTPIDIEVEIATEDLRNGNVYQFNLQSCMPDFLPYVNLRVESVIAKIEGVKSTISGKYLLNLSYSGKPFADRGVNRDVILFNTISRQRQYEYNVEGNDPQFSDKGKSWSDDVNPITPFSIWEISLPDTNMNKGIVFQGLTTRVTLTFVLNTRIHDEKLHLLKSNRMMLAKAMVPVKPSIDELVGQMSGKSVLNNWDIVFNMTLEKINNVLIQQYEELKNNDTDYGGKIITQTSIPSPNMKNILVFSLQNFEMKYGYPKLQFLINDGNTGNLEMQITAGYVQKGMRFLGDDTIEDRKTLETLAELYGLEPNAIRKVTIDGKVKLELEYYENKIPLSGTGILQAVLKIEQVKGLVKNNQEILSVILDMAKGTFEANLIEIEMSDEQKIAFSDAVKAYFVEHAVIFIINSLDLSGIATLPDLRPNQFYFKTLKTQKGNDILQLFIQTNKRETFDYSQTFINSNVSDPIPQGSETSLMINSRIFFGSVLPGSIQSGWKIIGNDPNDGSKSWDGQFSTAIIQGDIDLSNVDTKAHVIGYTTTWYTYEPTGGNPASWSLEGMTVKPTNKKQMDLGYDGLNKFYFTQNYDSAFSNYGRIIHSYGSNQLNTEIGLKITAPMPILITGSGRDQNIKIDISDKSVSVEARTSGGGPCGCDDIDAQINSQLRAVLPQLIASKLNVSFDSISVFALKNLLFPSKNYIKLNEAYIPGDMLIIGSFETDK